jgi:hypothetical protein
MLITLGRFCVTVHRIEKHDNVGNSPFCFAQFDGLYRMLLVQGP